VTVADDVGRYPPAEVEAAVYFSCLEALQNAAKHAAGGHRGAATVDRVPAGCCSRSPTTALGSTPRSPAAVHGYVNMADRLGAIGGTVRWDSKPGHGAAVKRVGSASRLGSQPGEGAGVPVLPQLA